MKFLISYLVFGLASFSPTLALESNFQNYSLQCPRIEQALQTLRKSDSRMRIYLGSSYENFNKRFFIPLNLRLISDSKPNASLTTIQSDFESKRAQFSEQFTIYSQRFEELIAVNCQSEPTNFYQKLVLVRSERQKLATLVQKIDQIILEHKNLVSALKESL